MNLLLLSRRQSLLAGAAALLPLRQALAQPAAAAGQWLDMIRQHHDLLERGFAELLAGSSREFTDRALQVRTLDQLIKSHSMAEENVIYPALVRAGLAEQAREAYRAEDEIKIIKSRLELAIAGRSERDWARAAVELRDAVLQHAREEEQRIFPQLQQRLDVQGNRLLSQLYPREFATVVPART